MPSLSWCGQRTPMSLTWRNRSKCRHTAGGLSMQGVEHLGRKECLTRGNTCELRRYGEQIRNKWWWLYLKLGETIMSTPRAVDRNRLWSNKEMYLDCYLNKTAGYAQQCGWVTETSCCEKGQPPPSSCLFKGLSEDYGGRLCGVACKPDTCHTDNQYGCQFLPQPLHAWSNFPMMVWEKQKTGPGVWASATHMESLMRLLALDWPLWSSGEWNQQMESLALFL